MVSASLICSIIGGAVNNAQRFPLHAIFPLGFLNAGIPFPKALQRSVWSSPPHAINRLLHSWVVSDHPRGSSAHFNRPARQTHTEHVYCTTSPARGCRRKTCEISPTFVREVEQRGTGCFSHSKGGRCLVVCPDLSSRWWQCFRTVLRDRCSE